MSKGKAVKRAQKRPETRKKVTQKDKRRFRDSKKWKDFREHMKTLQNETCQITGAKLTKLWQLHHMDLDESNYENLIDENFVCLSWNMHKVVHALFVKSKPRAWRSRVLNLIRILKKMEKLNSSSELK
jgi:hypothetical protein